MTIDWSKQDTAAMKEARALAAARAEAKRVREAKVAAITVKTSKGHVFNGDEASQGRMMRALFVHRNNMDIGLVKWVLANNKVVKVTMHELDEALRLAFTAQTAIWAVE